MRLINKEDLGWISSKSYFCSYVQKQPSKVFCKKRSSQKFRKIHRKKTFDRVCNMIKKETLAQVFSCEFCEISKNIFFTEHLLATAFFCHLITLVRFFQGLKQAYVVYILVFLDLILFVSFYDLMIRGLFRTLSNIQVGAF